MQVPYKWLQEFTTVPWKSEELAERLTLNGVAVDTVNKHDGGMNGVVAARVVGLRKLENSDHLYIAQMDVGMRVHQVVTGWPGIKMDQVLAFAPPGSTLPKNWKIATAAFAGVESQGMLCSATEMLLGDPHGEDEGVLELDASLPLGTDLGAYLGFTDDILELDLTPNYGHCLSMRGVAHEVAALTGNSVTLPSIAIPENDFRASDSVSIELKDPDLCPRYVARIVRDVKIGPSPAWLQARLITSGMRPINNIVDITNYVMLALGQPLHAFDYDRLRDKKIIVRRAGETQKFVTLDGQERALSPDMLVIADGQGPVAIAGVMGGIDSEVEPHTTNILIESALFEPISIRKTATSLNLRSEASSRFEKGIDPRIQIEAADLAAGLMCELAGATCDRGLVDEDESGYEPRHITLRMERVRRILGLVVDDEVIKRALSRLGFEVVMLENGISDVTIPSRRVDVSLEVDLVEEFGRIHGYEHVAPRMFTSGTMGVMTPYQEARKRSLEAMVGMGLTQIITFSFVSAKDFEKTLQGTAESRKAYILKNPLAEEQSVMRQSLLPGLLSTLSFNLSRKNKDLALFELGRVYLPCDQRLPYEPWHLSMVALDVPGSRSWNSTGMEADFYYAKGVVSGWVKAVFGESVDFTYEPSALPEYHPYRQARISVQLDETQKSLGYVGEISPEVAENYGITGRIAAFDIDLEPLLTAWPLPFTPRPIPRFPSIARDIALIVPDTVAQSMVESVLRQEAGELLESIELFDVYRGANIPDGARSLAYSLLYRAPERTLTDKEVDEHHERVRIKAQERTGAVIR